VPLSFRIGTSEFGVLGITLWPWAVLAGVAVFNASYLCYRWFIASWRFRHLADRDDPAALVAKVRQEEGGAGNGH
jgi:hypothetical protein